MSSVFRRLREFNAFRRILDRTPAHNKQASIIASADDEFAPPSGRLLDLAIAAARRARNVQFPDMDGRSSSEPRWYRIWPGEHYRLLAAIVAELGARHVIEIGTSTGMGALAIAQALPIDGGITTFDIAPWRDFKQTWLTPDDFSGARIIQEIADIARPGMIAHYEDLFRAADFIFVDGPKDGVMEQQFIAALASIRLDKNPIVMFDDIRVLNMIDIWRRLNRPKLDLTSFGHWSGTGLVDWNGRSESR
jgi:predicted O-methyltransferase YrrM